MCLFLVLSITAQNRIQKAPTQSATNTFQLKKMTSLSPSIERNYVYTGGESHQSMWSNSLKSIQATFFQDNLEGGNLDNFTVINGGDANGFVYSENGGNMAPGCVKLLYDTDTAHDDWLILPQITNVQAGTEVSFWTKNQSSDWLETFDVLISTGGNAAADFTTTVQTAITPGEQYEYFSFDLSAYAGQDIYVGIHSTTQDLYAIYFDDFKVFKKEQHDLEVSNIEKTNLVVLGESDTPKVTVKNVGLEEESAYSVELTATKVGETTPAYEETVSVTEAIAVDATTEVTFPEWTPEAGEYLVKATVILEGDLEATNDEMLSVDNTVCLALEDMTYATIGYSADTSLAKSGIVAFDAAHPGYGYIQISEDTTSLSGGDVVNGVWYAVTTAEAYKLYTIDFATGAKTEVADLSISEGIITDMAYDYSTNQMFATYLYATGQGEQQEQHQQIATIDLTDGTFTAIANVDDVVFLALACNLDGTLFGIGNNGKLYTIEKTTGAITEVGNTDVSLVAYLQSATFDHNTGKLYWAQFFYHQLIGVTSHMYEVNPATAEVTDLGETVASVEITSMVRNFELITYTTTLNVTDGTNPIEGANVTIGANQATTDASGNVVFELMDNTYNYTVVKPGYQNNTGSFTVDGADQTVNITMQEGDAEWIVEFSVSNDLGALEGATITMDGATATTDALGKASFSHINATDLAFTVEAPLHDTYSGTLTIADANLETSVTMMRTVHNLNFMVKKSWGSNDAIEGAVVNIVSGDSSYTVISDASGAANFIGKLEGDYAYTVSADGYTSATGNIQLTADVDQEILLDEVVTAPYALTVDVTGATTATFSWNNVTGFFDDFESYDDFSLAFSPWILKDEDGLNTYGFQNIPFEHAGEPMAAIIFNPSALNDQLTPAYSGNKFSATFNPAEGDNTCNDWIIAPKTKIYDGDKVTFFARGGFASYAEEKFQVMISNTDAEVTSFTNISDVVTCQANSVDWVEYSYNIPAEYVGQEVYIALHVTSVDQFYFCLDDFKIGNPAVAPTNNKSMDVLQSFTVTLDGVEQTTGLTETSFEFTGLTPQTTYTAGVKAVYESGVSELKTVEFTTLISGVEAIEENIVIAPNPTRDFVRVKVQGNHQIKVVDVLGRVISEQEMNDNAMIDLTQEKAGVYFVIVSNINNTQKFKVVKQ